MFQIVFALVWTVFGLAMFVLAVTGIAEHDGPAWQRWGLIIFPLFGLFILRIALRDRRRRLSLRIENEDGATIYVWTEFDGTECRSKDDPREDWDADGDGDGDGGD